MKPKRRSVIKKMLASVVDLAGIGMAPNTKNCSFEDKQSLNVKNIQDVSLFSGSTKFGNIVFISRTGAHVAPFEIKSHTEIVLKEIEDALIKAGSSMEKILKVTVYLNDVNDYKGMNEVYKGRFGKNPPVLTSIAVGKSNVLGGSLIEMDCIAYA